MEQQNARQELQEAQARIARERNQLALDQVDVKASLGEHTEEDPEQNMC